MPVLLRIAIRNLKEHRSKTLIIGIIIAVGVAILIIGNSLIDTAAYGIEKSFINFFTGDAVITGVIDGEISLFGAQSAGMFTETPVIPEYERVRSYVESHRYVDRVTSQITGFGIVQTESNQDMNESGFVLLFGIEAETYREIFDNIKLLDGEYLSPGQEGILLEQNNIEELEEDLGVDIGIGDKILISGFGTTGFKIREVPITGIFRFGSASEGAEMISYIDIQTIRVLKGKTVSNLGEIQLSDEEVSLLDLTDAESLFENDQEIVTDELDGTLEDEDSLFDILGDTPPVREVTEIDNGAWEYVIVKLKSPMYRNRFIREMNSWFKEEGIDAQVIDWKDAASPFSSTADVVRIVLNGAIFLVVIVALIIIINTLVISVIERTGEIGTMRALGAQKRFIRSMFTLEVLTISVTFGLIGIVGGLTVIGILSLIGFEATNGFLQVLFAGPELHPIVTLHNIGYTFLGVIVLGIIASLYPLGVALRVQPIKAMQTE